MLKHAGASATLTLVAGQPLPIALNLDRQPVRSETLLMADGPYTIALSTTLPDRAIALHSTYLGSPQSPTTAISHLVLAGPDTRTETVEVDGSQLPVDHARHHCLYHHLHRLQDLSLEYGLGPLAARVAARVAIEAL